MNMFVHGFEFNYADPNDPETHEFSDPNEAIEFFNNKGYGMENWEIHILLDFGIQSRITLSTFNDITDCWEE